MKLEFSTEQIDEIATLAATKALRQFQALSGKAPAQDNTEDIAGIDLAVKLTGLSKQSIYRKSSEGSIPVFRKGGKLYFSRKKLIAWIESGAKRTTAELLQESDNHLSKGK